MEKGIAIVFNEETNELRFGFGNDFFIIDKFQLGKGDKGENLFIRYIDNSEGIRIVKKMVERLL